jgi:glycopeptide antibiotics resistance protein
VVTAADVSAGPTHSRLALLSNAALAASVAAIALLTLFPVHRDNEVRLRPFSDIGEALLGPDVGLLVGSAVNVLLFLPFGAALRLRGFEIGLTAVLGLLVSGAVEGTQLFVSGRTTSVDDLLLNTTGAVLGNALAALWLAKQYAEHHD